MYSSLPQDNKGQGSQNRDPQQNHKHSLSVTVCERRAACVTHGIESSKPGNSGQNNTLHVRFSTNQAA